MGALEFISKSWLLGLTSAGLMEEMPDFLLLLPLFLAWADGDRANNPVTAMMATA
jgi:uncharacterized protein Usg